jgi:hypothetical protein
LPAGNSSGRPGRLCCDFRAQQRRTMSRCQRSNVAGERINRAPARLERGRTSRRTAITARSAHVIFGRK